MNIDNNLQVGISSKYIGKEVKYKKGKREYNVIITKRYNDEYFEVNTKSGKKTFLVKRSNILSQLQ